MKGKARKEQKEKEHGQALLLRMGVKEEPQFRILRSREKMKYIVKIQGKQLYKYFCQLAWFRTLVYFIILNKSKNQKPHHA